MNDVVDSLFQDWYESQEGSSWSDFVEEFYTKFGVRNLANVTEEFNKLKQVGMVQQNQVKFEELKSIMHTITSGST